MRSKSGSQIKPNQKLVEHKLFISDPGFQDYKRAHESGWSWQYDLLLRIDLLEKLRSSMLLFYCFIASCDPFLRSRCLPSCCNPSKET